MELKKAVSLSSSARRGRGLNAALPSVAALVVALSAMFSFLPFAASLERRQRRRLLPNESVARFLQEQHDQGVVRPAFTLIGQQIDKAQVGIFGAEEEGGQSVEFDIDLVEAVSSVTPETTYSTYKDGNQAKTPVGESNIKILVADPHSADSSTQFALIVVNQDTNEVHGIAQKKGEEMVSVRQMPGEENMGFFTVVETAEMITPTDWKCGNDHETDASRIVPDPLDEEPNDADGSNLFRDRKTRRTTALHGHGHHHHDHGHDNFTTNAKKYGILHEIQTQIGSFMNGRSTYHNRRRLRSQGHRKLYATDSFPQLYTYQVDLYIEIDSVLVSNNGDLATAIAYVNSIISAASAVYEKEIDTHLHVAHVALTNLYDSTTNTATALDIMKTTYGDADAWHYTDGSGIDLHHGIIGRRIGGGRASLDAICDSAHGFGISGGVDGSLGNIQAWDLNVVMHELGHNFGSGHTHVAYDPLIDTCADSDGNALCLVPVPSNSATIMSYCHLCSGGTNNILSTFGGYWNEDNRNDINNWNNNENLVGSISLDPKRVSKKMWETVSSKICVEPNILPVPTVTCTQDSDCRDGNSCTIDSCDTITNQCNDPVMQTNCCGNFECEVGEEACSDCSGFILATPDCSSCLPASGFMFDIVAGSSEILIDGLFFKRNADAASVSIYTVPGSYKKSFAVSGAWTEIVSTSISSASWGDYEQIEFSNAIFMSPGETRAFYIITTGSLLYLTQNGDILASDEYLSILDGSRRYSSSDPFSGGSDGRSWFGRMVYSIVPPCDDDTDCSVAGDGCKVGTCATDGTDKCGFVLSSSCCGNYICEAGEEQCRDCGPFSLATPECSSCWSPQGFMFDTISGDSEIEITGLSFRSDSGSATVRIYTVAGAYSEALTDIGDWTQIATVSINSAGWDYHKVDFGSSIIMNPGETRAFYIDSTNRLRCGQLGGSTLASDDNLTILDGGRSIGDTSIIGSGSDGYSWNGQILYSIIPDAIPPTTSPTTSPNRSPTDSPIGSPTIPPTGSPMSSPTTSPTASPMSSPTTSPTASPMSSPTTSPTASPMSSPTTSPTSSPVSSPTTAPTASPMSSPTTSPTSSPVSSPTTSPTASPMSSPTTSPTASPMSSPTTSPTSSPMSSPTTSPSASPMSSPTTSPSTSPMSSPTTSPTASPMSSPTTSPTASPMSSPTTSPTASPMSSPTTSPTASPMSSPTSSPTASPMSSPTTSPTASPMSSPTTAPTASPMSSTTTSPTSSPVSSPTTSPTASPMSLPTTSPTSSPMSSPTTSPTSSPMSSPTTSPSASPMSSPTTSPIASPMSSPTTSPTASPMSSPTTSPTSSPMSSPTSLPTASPMSSPTTSPTASPMFAPTTSPTSSPMSSPTTSPTASPMSSPTTSPTASPMSSPTASPTASPVSSPTTSPTASPMSSPTTSPTASPMSSPTTSPTASPMSSPTTSPTASPMFSPTASPMTSPTTSPTASPMFSPTTSPTASPMSSPTTSPTASPMSSPTTSPTASPMFAPTTSPTSSPMSSPTTSPTASPMTSPTTSPTASPMSSPTTSPTASPVSSPTTSPTASPMSSPTTSPTASPMSSPTTSPTASPITSPTTSPTSSPMSSPTTSPTASPMSSPTTSPTASPMSSPTTSPTASPMSSPTTSPTASPMSSPTTSPPTISLTGVPSLLPSKPLAKLTSEVQFIVEAIMGACPVGADITVYETILSQAAIIAAINGISSDITILGADSVVVKCTEVESLFRRLGSRLLEPFLVTSQVNIQTARLCIDACDLDESLAMQTEIEFFQGGMLTSVNDGSFKTTVDNVAVSMGEITDLVEGFEQMVEDSFSPIIINVVTGSPTTAPTAESDKTTKSSKSEKSKKKKKKKEEKKKDKKKNKRD